MNTMVITTSSERSRNLVHRGTVPVRSCEGKLPTTAVSYICHGQSSPGLLPGGIRTRLEMQHSLKTQYKQAYGNIADF